MNHIVVFGAGKSSSFLIAYLLEQLNARGWTLTLLDADVTAALARLNEHPRATAAQTDVANEGLRAEWISRADIVISLMPPFLHHLIAADCVRYGKHLLTASYIDADMASLGTAIKKKGLLFLCEMGLDPGIDHMSAMRLIHRLKNSGARITSFRSHCGGLVAPESDDNPWRYKISWNPRNIVMAGKAGAVFRDYGQERNIPYQQLFDARNTVSVAGPGELGWYANRNSLEYIDTYALSECETFIRTTLRYPEFISGWNRIVRLGLTDDETLIDTDGLSLQRFFSQYIDLQTEPPAFIEQMNFLGLNDPETMINSGTRTPVGILQFAMERKLTLDRSDKDMIVMLHELEYLLNGEPHKVDSHLIVKGDDHINTAMAKTVGLPLAIACRLIMEEKIRLTGLHVPILPEIYEPVLQELETMGIIFHER